MALELTRDEVVEYLAIDFIDSRINNILDRYIKLADKFLIGALGEGYPGSDERVKEIALLVIADLYDDHSLEGKSSGTIRRLLNDFQLQVKLEMRSEDVNSI